MWWLYHAAIRLYGGVLRLAAFAGHPKAAAGWQGRRDLSRQMRSARPLASDKPVAWVHCASLGEFEQARPLLQALRSEGWQIALTFFSPSGYEKRKGTPLADWVGYLPLDTPANARRFVSHLNPDIAIFIRYEFWWALLRELFRRDIPAYLASAAFRPQQLFFRPFIGAWYRRRLEYFRRIFIIDEASERLLARQGIRHVETVGDTRADRVLQIAEQGGAVPELERFSKGFEKLVVCGSTWPQDIRLLLPAMQASGPSVAWVIAPHEVSDSALSVLWDALDSASLAYLRHSEYGGQGDETTARVFVLDGIGLLARAYQHGQVAYVGGGFGAGIHNVLEPAAHGIAVLFGPRCRKFPEALGLARAGGGIRVDDAGALREQLAAALAKPEDCRRRGALARAYVRQLSHATSRIMRRIQMG